MSIIHEQSTLNSAILTCLSPYLSLSACSQGSTPPLLVFVQSKERAKELFHELIYDGLNVEVIHADRTQAQRDNIIKSFRAGRVSGCTLTHCSACSVIPLQARPSIYVSAL